MYFVWIAFRMLGESPDWERFGCLDTVLEQRALLKRFIRL